jgi:hypothetical protein
MEETNTNKINIATWLRLLLRAVIRHGLALIFVLILIVIFRMPHLSDLTVVIIQLENNADFVVMSIFYASILVMALLISYGNLVRIPSDADILEDTAEVNLDHEQVQQTKFMNKVTKAINLKDSMERSFEQKEVQNETLSGDSLEDSPEESENPKLYIDRIYPKVLAIYMILGITFSVENTYFELTGSLITFKLLFPLLIVFLIALTHPGVGAFLKRTLKWKARKGVLPIIGVAVSILVIMVLGILNDGGTKSDIANLFWSMMSLSVLFFFLSISYNAWVLWFKEKIAMPLAYFLTAIIILIYLIMLVDPELHQLKKLTPVVIIMVCIIGQYVIFLGLNYVGKIRKWPVLTVVFSTAILLTILVAKSDRFKHYEVSTVAAENIHPDDRLSLEAYVDQYIAERREAILAVKGKEQFPIILVSAEGGGSRAGHWAFLVHSYLYGKSENYFKKHLFSITGASGGSVGSNMFYVQAYAHKDKYDSLLFLAEKDYSYKASQFYQNDYISSSVAGLLGRDIVASVLHLNYYKDRGKITEMEWEHKFDELFDPGLLSRSYLDIMPKENASFTPPIMVTTTTHVQTGQLYIMSPVKFNINKERASGFNDLLSQYANKNQSSTMIKRSAAMLLTARFPYLSPNGRITGVGQFGDGGYYDNVGGVVTKHLEAALLKGLRKDTLLHGKYKIKHLIITNHTPEKESVDYYSQLVTPGQMAVNAIFAHADEFVNATSEAYRVASKRTAITTQTDASFKPLIPLGRYLSKDAVRSLEERLKDPEEVKNRLDELMEYQ